MNATAGMDRRESISSPALAAKDEAALVDSFFLPGGILDPDQDEGKEEEHHKMQPVGSGAGPSSLTITAPAAPLPEATLQLEESQVDQRNSFWSTAGSASLNHSNGNSYLQPVPGGPVVPSSAESSWPAAISGRDSGAQALLEDPLQENRSSQGDEQVHDLLLNPSTSLFPYDTSFKGSFTELPVVPDSNNNPAVQHHHHQQLAPPGLPPIGGDPLGAALGPASTTNAHKPPPSAQEEEDLRQMVLALSSSLKNIGESSDPNIQEQLLPPDSPPKIIRRISSVSGSNRPSNSIPLEFPDDELHGDGNDLHSTTSSLSSGSACRNDNSHSPVQLSDHYRPPATSLLAQDPLPLQAYPSIPIVQAQEDEPPAASFTPTPASTVPPPPGYQPLLPSPRQRQFQLEEETVSIPSPSPSVPKIPSPLPSVSIPSSPQQELEPEISGLTTKFPDEDSFLTEESPLDTIPHSGEVEIPQPQSTTDQPKKTDAIRRRSTTTTTTTTMVDSPAAAAAFRPQKESSITPPSRTNPSKRRRNRKQSKKQNNALENSTATDRVQEETFNAPSIRVQESQPNQNKKQTKKISSSIAQTTNHTRTTKQTAAKSQPGGTTPAIELAQQLVHFGTGLLTCMVQEAIKEALERKSVAVDYAVLYMTPVLAECIMDQWVWLPHSFPGIVTAAALSWVCHRMEKYPNLSIGDLTNEIAPKEEMPSKPTPNKKKTRPSTDRISKQSSKSNSSSPEDQRLAKLRVMEAKISHWLLGSLRWILPAVVVVVSGIQTSDELQDLPCLRLVTAFGLSMLKTYNLFSPVAWISLSFQMSVIFGMRTSHSYMQRWFGLEILIASFGLSTLRFIRLIGTKKGVKCRD